MLDMQADAVNGYWRMMNYLINILGQYIGVKKIQLVLYT